MATLRTIDARAAQLDYFVNRLERAPFPKAREPDQEKEWRRAFELDPNSINNAKNIPQILTVS